MTMGGWSSRRRFLKVVGVSGGVSLAFISEVSRASVWRKVSGGGVPTPSKARIPLKSNRINSIAVASSAVGKASYYLRSDGVLFGTGSNSNGQLGINLGATTRSSMVQCTGVSQVVSIAGGYKHVVALRADGLVFACGNNASGALGDGTGADRSTFVQTTGISNAIAVSAGDSFSMALGVDGMLYGCGDNSYGQLGFGTLSFVSSYVQSTGVSQVRAIACGYRHTLALRADGLLFGCGYNSNGTLGINSATAVSTFVQCVGISNVIAMGAGSYNSYAITSDGNVYSTGRANYGALGNYSTAAHRSTYGTVIGISNAVAIAAGRYHVLALRSDGLVFSCGGGNTSGGECGDGQMASRSTFVQAIGLSNMCAINAGRDISIALRSDGLVFTAGINAGALGTNDTINRSSFVQVLGV